MKVFVTHKTQAEKENDEMIRSIDDVLRDLEIAYSHFNSVTDEALIESVLLEIKMLEAKYKHLISSAKERNVIANAKRSILVPILDAEYAIS